MQKLPYNKPLQVTKEVYKAMMDKMSNEVAGREDNGNYFIKLLIPNERKAAEKLLNKLMKW